MAAHGERPALAVNLDMLRQTVSNASSHLAPTLKDMVLALPRLAARFTNLLIGKSHSASGGMGKGYNATGNATGAALPGSSTPPGASEASSFFSAFSLQQIRTFGGIFSYMTSKWALGCFAAGIILNRTTIYAASRRHLQLGWKLRLALRLVPLVVLLWLGRSILRTMRCQTSPDYSLMKTGELDSAGLLDFAEDGGMLYWLSSVVLFWETDRDSCRAVNMIAVDGDMEDFHGSMALTWTAFLSLTLSQFVETLSCAVQGQAVATETGMTLFEHSLAFAEAEAIVSSHAALLSAKAAAADGSSQLQSPTQSSIFIGYFPKNPVGFSRYNTSPEILLMALISCLNNIASQTLGVLGWQAKYRLINTGVWGICFMASFIWGFFSFSADQGVEAGILRFPTVCVVGFIPHTLILVGIFLCGCIYALAVLLSVLAPPEGIPQGRTLRERFKFAHENMQANVQLSGIRLYMHEDFYTALLRIGFTALTAASEAVFLNEGRRINIGQWTWLEDERMNEIIRLRTDSEQAGVANGVYITSAESNKDSAGGAYLRGWQSGYARERSTKVLKGRSSAVAARGQDGVGAMQRGGRYALALTFLIRILRLAASWSAMGLIRALDLCGIEYRPRWLRRLQGVPKGVHQAALPKRIGSAAVRAEGSPGVQFWQLGDDGELILPDENTDVETHTRRQMQRSTGAWGPEREAELDSKLYHWWISGGWWGEQDSSADYQAPPIPADDTDDTTSVLSFATTNSSVPASDLDSDLDTHSDDSGRRTPTPRDPFPSSHRSRRGTPAADDTALDAASLARLLAPQDTDARRDARRLAAHLTAPHALTRSQYARATAVQDARVLTSSRLVKPRAAASGSSSAGATAAETGGSAEARKLSPAEEADVLEQLIVRFRAKGSAANGGAKWNEGGGGMGGGGPVCVVCQSEPRTVMAWPCRCLSLCEDCRVSLAMNNFGNCVCCRQEVVGFSRLYVP